MLGGARNHKNMTQGSFMEVTKICCLVNKLNVLKQNLLTYYFSFSLWVIITYPPGFLCSVDFG